ncbi:MAG: hypothetical protein V1735_03955 [Nanoarchaeota archaeon]
MRPLLFFLICLSAFPTALAIGIGPSDTVIDFEPNLEAGFTNVVMNNQETAMPITIYKDEESDLSPYVILPENLSMVLPPLGRAVFTYRLKLPENLGRPGFHDISVGAVEGESSGGMIRTATAAMTRLRVRVPYPGTYLAPFLQVESVEHGKPAKMDLTVTNRGTETVAKVTGKATIKSQGEAVGEVDLSPVENILPRESKTLTGTWTDTGKVGEYMANASFSYGGKHDSMTAPFMVGTENVEILSFPNTAERDRINPFPIRVKSVWNYPLTNVYAIVAISQAGSRVADLSSPTNSLSPWQEISLEAFWDTRGLELGEYDVNVVVHFQNKTSIRQGKITLVAPMPEEKPKAIGTSTLIIALIAVLILVVGINVFFLLKKKRG